MGDVAENEPALASSLMIPCRREHRLGTIDAHRAGTLLRKKRGVFARPTTKVNDGRLGRTTQQLEEKGTLALNSC